MDVIYLSIFFTNFSSYTYHTWIGIFIVHDLDHGRRRHDHRGRHVLNKERNGYHNHYRYLMGHRNCHYLRYSRKKEFGCLENQTQLTLVRHA
jgi:hypothetical protein